MIHTMDWVDGTWRAGPRPGFTSHLDVVWSPLERDTCLHWLFSKVETQMPIGPGGRIKWVMWPGFRGTGRGRAWAMLETLLPK